MAAAAHDPAFAKKVGIPQSVAKDFNQADKGTGMIKPKSTPTTKDLAKVRNSADRMLMRMKKRKDTDKDGDATGPDLDKDGK